MTSRQSLPTLPEKRPASLSPLPKQTGRSLSAPVLSSVTKSPDDLLSRQYSRRRPPSGLLERRMSQMPTLAEEKKHVAEVHGHGSKRAKLLEILHSKPVQYTLMGLLLLDVILLFIEMFLMAEFPFCHIIERDAISCCAACPMEYVNLDGRFMAEEVAGGDDSDHSAQSAVKESDMYGECGLETAAHDTHDRYLAEAGGDGEHHSVCLAGVESQCPAGCDEHKWAAVHTTEKVIFWLTVVILSIFVIELLLMMVCIGLKTFFSKLFYVVDFFIVSVSLILECVFYSMKQSVALEGIAGAIIILRVWRFVRIGHGLVEVTHELSTEKFNSVIDYVHRLEELLEKENIAIPDEACTHAVDKIVHHKKSSLSSSSSSSSRTA